MTQPRPAPKTPRPIRDDPRAGHWEGLAPPYATIVADPPWPYEEDAYGRPGKAFLPYSSMAIEDIAALPVGDLAAPGAHLYLWTTNRYLWDTRDIALGWGFAPSKVLVWCKEPTGAGSGGLFAQATEYIVFARADYQVERAGVRIRAAREAAELSRAELYRLVFPGKRLTGLVDNWETDLCLPTVQAWQRLQQVLPELKGVDRPAIAPPPKGEIPRVDRNWWQWKRGPHSAKPPAFLDLVEQVSPAPRVELFARAQRLGWDSWGWGHEYAV
jgi:N6-adenosine-specific RNA methylase IME4